MSFDEKIDAEIRRQDRQLKLLPAEQRKIMLKARSDLEALNLSPSKGLLALHRSVGRIIDLRVTLLNSQCVKVVN